MWRKWCQWWKMPTMVRIFKIQWIKICLWNLELLLIVYEDGDTQEDSEARALLNKFFGATALMTSIENNPGMTKEFLSSGGAKNKNVSRNFCSYRLTRHLWIISLLFTKINKILSFFFPFTIKIINTSQVYIN